MQFMLSRLALAGFEPEDDIDKLFSRLPQIEPPGELIARILSHVQRLPTPSALPSSGQQRRPERPAIEGGDALIVRKENCEPS
jgi:hypothetical protein